MRRLLDHQDRPAQFLQQEVGGLDRRSARSRALAVGPDFRVETAVLALMGKGNLDATPCGIRCSQVTRDDGSDHAAATAPLWAGFKPGEFVIKGPRSGDPALLAPESHAAQAPRP